jgi:hypothetical protein
VGYRIDEISGAVQYAEVRHLAACCADSNAFAPAPEAALVQLDLYTQQAAVSVQLHAVPLSQNRINNHFFTSQTTGRK